MANIQINNGSWYDLGKLKSKKKIKIMNKIVIEYIFEGGKLTTSQKL